VSVASFPELGREASVAGPLPPPTVTAPPMLPVPPSVPPVTCTAPLPVALPVLFAAMRVPPLNVVVPV
jgi:hypothetical protein